MKSGRDFSVPKSDLVGALEVTLSTRRLHAVPGLPHTAEHDKELRSFGYEIGATGRRKYEGKGAYDDIVTALSLALWGAERGGNASRGLVHGIHAQGHGPPTRSRRDVRVTASVHIRRGGNPRSHPQQGSIRPKTMGEDRLLHSDDETTAACVWSSKAWKAAPALDRAQHLCRSDGKMRTRSGGACSWACPGQCLRCAPFHDCPRRGRCWYGAIGGNKYRPRKIGVLNLRTIEVGSPRKSGSIEAEFGDTGIREVGGSEH